MTDDYYERMYWECKSEISFLEAEITRLEKINKMLSIENASYVEQFLHWEEREEHLKED
jgi:hypothetical protein